MIDENILVFDVDGTLAPCGAPMGRHISEALREMETAGNTICIASGLSCLGLEGLMRGIGLMRAVVIGENGAAASAGIAKKPIYVLHRPVFFNALEREIARRYTDVYFQHNMVNVTAISQNDETLDDIVLFLRSKGYMDRRDVTVYENEDSVEIVPGEASKGFALARLKKKLGWNTECMVAVGDGPNDVSMRTEVGEFFSVGSKIDSDRSFSDIDEMMDYMRKRFS